MYICRRKTSGSHLPGQLPREDVFVVGCDTCWWGLRDCKLYVYTSTRSRYGPFGTWYLRLDLLRAGHSAAQHCANEN